MEAFFAHLAAAEEQGAGMFLQTIQWGAHGELTVMIAVHPLQHRAHGILSPTPSQRWAIDVRGIVAYALTDHEIVHLQLLDDHPLLWGSNRQPKHLHLHGSVAHPTALLGGLYHIHSELTAETVPFLTYFNARTLAEFITLLESGHGVLAEGPEHVLRAYQTVVEAHGSAAWLTGLGLGDEIDAEAYRRWCKDRVLVWGRSYIVADQFTFTPTEDLHNPPEKDLEAGP